MTEDFFCVKSYTAVNNEIYTLLPSFVKITSENGKIVLFQPRHPPFLGIANIVFTGSLLVALKKSQFDGKEMGMQT